MAKKAPKRVLPPPECKAVLLCERVLVDPFTGLYSVINIFDNIIIYNDHAVVSPYRLYVELTGGSGQYLIAVEIQELEESMLLGKEERAITLTDRSEKWIGVFEVPAFEVWADGSYEIVVFADGEPVGQRGISIIDGREAEDGEEKGSGQS
jgi:hypothetical protein